MNNAKHFYNGKKYSILLKILNKKSQDNCLYQRRVKQLKRKKKKKKRIHNQPKDIQI